MGDRKMRDGQKCRGGKCGTIEYGAAFSSPTFSCVVFSASPVKLQNFL